jgi:TolA protein
MTQRFSNAIVASAVLHAAVIALLLAIAYLAGLRTGKPLDFFELVAGEGDNYLATEAPALGTADGDPAKVAEAPAPTMVMTATKAPAPTPAPKDVDFSKNVQKSAAKASAKIAAQTKAEEAKAAKEEAAREKAANEAAAKQAKMTLEEFNRLNKGKTPSPANPKANTPKVDAKGIAGGVVGGSTANTKGGAGGTAMTAAQRGVVEAYTSMLKQQLQKNLQDQSPPGLSDTLMATASMRMLPNGSLTGGTIVKSSGNAEFDKAVLDAIRLTNLPDRPSGFETGTFTLDFKARDKNE